MKANTLVFGGVLFGLAALAPVSCKEDRVPPLGGGKSGSGGEPEGGEGGEGGSPGGAGGLAGASGGGGSDGGSGGSDVDPCIQNWRVYSRTRFDELVQAKCTKIDGFLEIGVPELLSVEGLETITRITGYLDISAVVGLKSLKGLENLTNVGDYVKLFNLPELTSIEELGKLTKVTGDLHIETTALSSLKGLDAVTSIGGALNLSRNGTLASLEGLGQVESVGSLTIFFNEALTALDPIHGWPATAVKGELYIAVNHALPACEVTNFDKAQTDPDAACATTGSRQCLGNTGMGTCE